MTKRSMTITKETERHKMPQLQLKILDILSTPQLLKTGLKE